MYWGQTIRRALSRKTSEEQKYLEQLATWLKDETGYQWIQGTRPQTLAFALTDLPAGLAAWIIQKFRAWSDCGGDLESVFTKDELLANVSFYWFTGAIGSSFWPYYARMHRPWPVPDNAKIACADWLLRISARDPPAPTIAGSTHIHRRASLDRYASRRSFCSNGAARSPRCRDT